MYESATRTEQSCLFFIPEEHIAEAWTCAMANQRHSDILHTTECDLHFCIAQLINSDSEMPFLEENATFVCLNFFDVGTNFETFCKTPTPLSVRSPRVTNCMPCNNRQQPCGFARNPSSRPFLAGGSSQTPSHIRSAFFSVSQCDAAGPLTSISSQSFTSGSAQNDRVRAMPSPSNDGTL